VLSRKDGALRDLAVRGQPEPEGVGDDLLIHDRQRTGMAQADGVHLGVRLGAEGGRVGAENLRFGVELDMDFESDDRLVSVIRHEWVQKIRGALG
jgi:hypothetical protein